MTYQKNILIIDDDPQLLSLYQRILTSKNSTIIENTQESILTDQPFRLFLAQQGLEALRTLEALQDDSIQVAFIDMNMPPGWSGVVTTLELLKHDPRIQIVIVSGLSLSEQEEALRAIPQKIQFLPKPFQLEQIQKLAIELCAIWNEKYFSIEQDDEPCH